MSLPDAFTPNGDSRYDIFHIITDNPNILVINLDVYNRWGQQVFRSNVNNRVLRK
jgi:gliding motility-associated-like protein